MKNIFSYLYMNFVRGKRYRYFITKGQYDYIEISFGKKYYFFNSERYIIVGNIGKKIIDLCNYGICEDELVRNILDLFVDQESEVVLKHLYMVLRMLINEEIVVLSCNHSVSTDEIQ